MAVGHRGDHASGIGDARIAADDPLAGRRLSGCRYVGVMAERSRDGVTAIAEDRARARARDDQIGDRVRVALGAHPRIVGVTRVLELVRGLVGGNVESGVGVAKWVTDPSVNAGTPRLLHASGS